MCVMKAGLTASVIVVAAGRERPSMMLIGMVFGPWVIAAPMIDVNANVCSPAGVGAPTAAKLAVAEPPIDVRSPVTVKLVLVGLLPGVATTVSVTDPPSGTTSGAAEPVPVGKEHPGGDSVLCGVGTPITKSTLF